MLKIRLSLSLLIIVLILPFQIALAKNNECERKPTYDIIVKDDLAQFINDNHNLKITSSGLITLDDVPIQATSKVKKQAQVLHAFLYQQLPRFENQSHQRLNDTRAAFEIAIRDKLGNKSELLKNLNSLNDELNKLLKKAINTREGVTYFYHQPFNNLKQDGEARGKNIFYKVIGNSILHFDVFKNYSAIKKIAKNEWKIQKVKLKEFDHQVCELIIQIDQQYNQLILELSEL